MITSKQNPLIKNVRALINQSKARADSQSFVVEGLRLAEEAVRASWPVEYGLHSGNHSKRGLALVQQLSAGKAGMQECSPELMKSLSDTQNPQGILLVLPQQHFDMAPVLDFLLILDALQDPGNMGSLLRSAWGAGVNAVILGPRCVDPFLPKVLRSAMGAHFHVPLIKMDWENIKQLSADRELDVFVSHMGKGQAYNEAHHQKGIALIIGNEAKGVGPEALALAKQSLHIPLAKGLESLNAAAAGAILLFEIARQKQEAINRQ